MPFASWAYLQVTAAPEVEIPCVERFLPSFGPEGSIHPEEFGGIQDAWNPIFRNNGPPEQNGEGDGHLSNTRTTFAFVCETRSLNTWTSLPARTMLVRTGQGFLTLLFAVSTIRTKLRKTRPRTALPALPVRVP